VAAITVAANVTAVNVHIINQGCQPVDLNGLPLPSTLLGLAGVRLPAAPIEDGQMGVATLPPVTLHVDARDPTSAALEVIGIVLPRANLSTVDEISFDGKPVLGRQASFDLGGSKEHELLIACYH
jgi:hypothetical protein